MSEQSQQQFTIKLSLPDVVTMRVYETFSNARQDYIRDCAAKKLTANAALADYHGALAVIRAGFVHIETDLEPLKAALKPGANQDETPLEIIALIVLKVANPVTEPVNTPLSALMSKLSLTESIPSDTSAPAR